MILSTNRRAFTGSSAGSSRRSVGLAAMALVSQVRLRVRVGVRARVRARVRVRVS